MELRHLRYFLAVAQELNFTRAAAELCIAQPPLSRQIQDLETELGTRLFVRGHNSLRLTEEGMLFRQYATQILDLVEKSTEDIREMNRGLQGMLYVASVEGHGPRLLSQWIAGFHQIYPHVQYTLWNGNSDDVLGRVSKGLCDLAIIVEPYNPEGLNGLRVYREPWVAMIPSGHPLAQLPGDSVPLAALADCELIIPSRQSRFQEIEGWFPQGHGKLTVRGRVAHMLNAYELTAQGVGVAIYPASAGALGDTGRVVMKRLTDPSVTASYVLVWSKSRQLPLVAREFVEYVENQLAQGQSQ